MENINNDEFLLAFKQTLDNIYEKVKRKSEEYSDGTNPFHNFEVGADLTNQCKESVLHGFLLKHLISYVDHINFTRIHQTPLFKGVVLQDKVEDIIVYLIIEQIMNTPQPVELPF